MEESPKTGTSLYWLKYKITSHIFIISEWVNITSLPASYQQDTA